MRQGKGCWFALLPVFGLALLLAAPARAQIGSDRYAAILIDHATGRTLVEANADEARHPASLTKMMTIYLLFEALRDGRLTPATRIEMSEEAASRPPSKLGLPVGASLSVEHAILALITKSANDVAAAVAETLAGSEPRFAQLMTMRARSLGMSRTTFRNASGLPDPEQLTTARDMALLGRRLMQDFPQHYHLFGNSHVQFGGMRLRNHNGMLRTYEGTDGLKTGYVRASGFNIVTSASRGGKRLVGAVFGGSSWAERDEHMAALMDRGFETLGVAPRVAAAVAPEGLRTARLAAVGAVPTARAATPARPAARPAAQPASTPPRTSAERSDAPRSRAVPSGSARLPAPPPPPPQPAVQRRSPTVTPPGTLTTQTAPRTASRTSNSALATAALPAPRPR
jgi:D-alanyl-D-alanine carboxypeptidase